MKHTFLIGALCAGGLVTIGARAQTIPVLTEQLAALHDLAHTTQQGYQLVTKGLQDIGVIRTSEYQLHTNYFGSLSAVKPQLANDPKVKALLTLQTRIQEQLNTALDYWRHQRSLQP